MIKRTLQKSIKDNFFKGKAIIVLGPRQVGKTTLIQGLLKNKPHLFLNGDDSAVRNMLSAPSTVKLKQIIGKNKLVFVNP